MARRGVPGWRTLAGLAVVILTASGPVVAEACPYPLGDGLLTGDARTYGGPQVGPENQTVDALYYGAQLGPARFVEAGGALHMVFESEAEYDLPNSTLETEVHTVAYKAYSPRTGWNTRPLFPSSDDMADPLPFGSHTSPTAVAAGGALVVAWQAAGAARGPVPWPTTGTYLVMRTLEDGAWGPIEPLSGYAPVSSNILVDSAPVPGGAFFTWQTNAGENDSSTYHIVGRQLKDGVLGPLENISAANDGWSEKTPAVVHLGGSLGVVWAARNASDPFARGASQVWLSTRNTDGPWSVPFRIDGGAMDSISHPAVAWYNDSFYVAWPALDVNSTNTDNNRMLLRAFSLSASPLGSVMELAGPTFSGFETSPVLRSWGGRLWAAWVSTSDPARAGTTYAVANMLVATFDGTALSRARVVDDPDGESYGDLWPALVPIGDGLFASYALDTKQPVGNRQDQRQVTVLLERPARPTDGLSATYTSRVPERAGPGTATYAFTFALEDGSPYPSDHFAVDFADGTRVRFAAGFSSGSIDIPFLTDRPSPPVGASWCGVAVPLTRTGEEVVPPPFLPGAGVAPIVVAALALAFVQRARRGRGDP